jgi:hypothetical protein
MKFRAGQTVFVPTALVSRHDAEVALAPFKVAEVGGSEHPKSIRVVLHAAEDPDDGWVASALVHSRVGIYLVRVGDFSTESALLDPLAKGLNHFFRLLVGNSDDYFKIAYIRTRHELAQFWANEHRNVSHLVIVAHGRRDAIRFVGNDAHSNYEDWMTGDELQGFVDAITPVGPAHIVSLACLTGYADFSRPLSLAQACVDCIAPLHSVHGAIASQFCQTLFVEHFLHGRRWPIAFRNARESTPGVSTFRRWEHGGLRDGTTGQ